MAVLKARQSHIFAKHPHGWYVEPAWCAERLFATERFACVWDPASGLGTIPDAAERAGLPNSRSDIVVRAHRTAQLDFLSPDSDAFAGAWDIVSNPPYHLADAFVLRALKLARSRVAMLLPLTWMSGRKRSRWLKESPLEKVIALTPRPSMPPGEMILAGHSPQGGRVDYGWFLFSFWATRLTTPTLHWIERDAA